MPIVRLLERPARYFPDKVAIIDDQGGHTFAEVDSQAGAFAAALSAAGAKAGDRVALILPNGAPFVVTEIAIAKAGMVKVPLNVRLHAREILYALNDCEPAVLVCPAQFADSQAVELAAISSLRAVFTIGGAPDGCLPYEEALASSPVETACHGPDDVFVIRYTGGTTGKPKGIMHTAGSFLNITLDCIREFHYSEHEVALHVAHMSHGLNYMWASLYALGATQILHEAFEPQRILADIGRFGVTFVYMVPTMIHRLLKADDGSHDVSSLRTFMYASAPMPVPLLERAIARYGNIFMQVYTLSEAPVISTIFRAHEHVQRATVAGPRLASCGREALTMELRLIDDEGQEPRRGEVGEIVIRSANNMLGYWRRPEDTAKCLVDGWVHTGDMARRDEEGYLYVVDRKNDVIITGALNVYPKEVEDALLTHPDVSQAVVIGVPDEEWGEIIRAYVVCRDGVQPDGEALVAHCKAQLASYKKPREFRFVEQLPLTPIGKVSRAALRAQARAEQGDR